MTRNTYDFCFLVLTLAGLAGCSSEPTVKPVATPPEKIQGKAQILLNETAASDAALNAGGPSVYLIDGLTRYRLFFHKPFHVEAGQVYTVDGVNAQKSIDAIGDPDQGKDYPLEASCAHVVKAAWPGLAFDVTDGYTNSLRARVKRFPARPVFLVTRIEAVPSAADAKDAKKDKKVSLDEEKEDPKVTIPAEKLRALLVEGPSALTAPLWDTAGGTVHCKVVVDEQGKIEKLNTGAQLCETVPWAQFRYKPTLQGGHPVRVASEVEVHFDPRK